MLSDDLPTAFVDLETTGSRAGFHRITEIAIVTASPHGEIDEWSTLLNPGREIPLQISALTGISNEMVADAPHFDDIWRDIFERLDGHLFVAHNVRFDYGFLRAAFRALSVTFRPRRLCTVALSRQLYPQERHHNLDALMQRHGLTCEPRHRALTDARALWEFCVKVGEELGHDALRDAVHTQLAGPALPSGLDPASIEALGEGPGVYRFLSDDGALLYVGKSVNVRSRVLAHFSAAAREDKERKLFARTAGVESVATAGELGALLLEAATIKRETPLLNRRLRHRATIFTLALDTDTDGYHTPVIEELECPDDEVPRYGTFRQRKAAQRFVRVVADEHGLCRKKLGLERGAGSCFGYQLKRCRGACIGAQSPVAWNLALMEALGKTRLRRWPFDGAVVVTEKRGRRVDLHVLDRWCLIGTVHDRHEIGDLLSQERQFDIDIYRILLRFLDKSAHKLTISPAEPPP